MEFGGWRFSANALADIASATGRKISKGLSALAKLCSSRAVVFDAATFQAACIQGTYKLEASLSVETEDISGTSGDGVGNIRFQFRKNGVLIDGAEGQVNHQAIDRPAAISILGVVEITAAEVTAGTNTIALYATSTDASGNDYTIRYGHVLITKIDG